MPTKESPEADGKIFCKRVERNVAARALWVVEATELRSGRMEPTAGDHRRSHSGSNCVLSDHLIQISVRKPSLKSSTCLTLNKIADTVKLELYLMKSKRGETTLQTVRFRNWKVSMST